MDPPTLDDTMPDNERLSRALRKYLNLIQGKDSVYGFEKTSGCTS